MFQVQLDRCDQKSSKTVDYSVEGHHQTAITTNLVSSINARGEGVRETILCDKVLSVTFDNSTGFSSFLQCN